ncbi:reprolysin-like metallopeptidase [Microbacterium sp. Leaf179]|uniref:reprolysin-like metallopeptidase n=1 Tax=Microbacterium sp. Leaf179 TaxID=1736288 RepID=UPI0006FDA457|nr:M12 family metallo-peptidase [Microbacterium sp. Leaf179]KQR88466.1 hypothetical protein ASF96_01345 [Microbacterium sp. Leaf179]
MIRRFAAVAATVALIVSSAPTVSSAAPDEGSEDALWTPLVQTEDSDLPVRDEASRPYELDVAGLSALFAAAPDAATRSTANTTRLSVPTPDGDLVEFAVAPVDLLDVDLRAAHPELRTFAGRGVDDEGLSIRADLTPLGFHAMVRSGDNATRAWYVEPANVGDTARYVSYAAGSLDVPRLTEVEHDDIHADTDAAARAAAPERAAALDDPAPVLRTVRLALASDPAFARFYGTQNVLAAKVSMVNRVAGVFNDDLGLRLLLADGTDSLNFDTDARAVGADGPCGADACFTPAALAGCDVETLRQNSAAVQTIVGTAGYDIGHLVLGGGGGGIAGYGEVGLDFVKGGGCTGSASPIGDAFAIDYLAHELGHQLGASHTFNACGGSSGDTAVEPGSGSTVMAYAGICGDNDLQPHSDPYLSQASIVEIHRTIDGRLADVPTGNAAPTVTPPAPRMLPLRTPFTLAATGSDPDGNSTTYLWEQTDVGDPDRGLFDDAKSAGPLFRTFGTYVDTSSTAAQYFSTGGNRASRSAARTFPDMAQVLAGTTNAVTGTCDPTLTGVAKIECFSEYLPSGAYVGAGAGTGSIDFRVTARDADPRGGVVAFGDVRLTLDRDAGPLLVSGLDPASADSYPGGSRQTLRWQVNGTDAAALAPNVRIVLSTDAGKTFDTVLAASTPNDGSQSVVLPDVTTSAARIKVEAVDNYFFAVDPGPFEIQQRAAAVLSTGSDSAESGSEVTISGSGFTPRENVDVTLVADGGTVDTRVAADDAGAFRARVRVPLAAAAGRATLTAVGAESASRAITTITIVAAPTPTPTATPAPTTSPSATPTPTTTPAPVAPPGSTATPPAVAGATPGRPSSEHRLASTGTAISGVLALAAAGTVVVGLFVRRRRRRVAAE